MTKQRPGRYCRQTYTLTDRDTHRQSDMHTHGQTDRQTGGYHMTR